MQNLFKIPYRASKQFFILHFYFFISSAQQQLARLNAGMLFKGGRKM